MPKLNVLPFRWYHLEAMDLRDQEKAYLALFDDYLAIAREQEKRGPCFTVFVEDEGPACSYGFVPLWHGVWECWLITATLVEKYPMTTIRAARRAMLQIESDLQAHRLQMTVNARVPLSLRFAEALNFAPEGVLKSYGPDGSDYIMLARTI